MKDESHQLAGSRAEESKGASARPGGAHVRSPALSRYSKWATFDTSKPGAPWGERICFEEPDQPGKGLVRMIGRRCHGSGSLASSAVPTAPAG